MEYRANFIFETAVSLLEVGMYLFYWKIFFSISDGIPGASYEQLAALVAFNHVIYAGADTLMGSSVWQVGQLIITGQLDIFLVQPKSVIYQIFFSGAQPVRGVQIVVGTALFFMFVPLTLSTVVLYIFGCLTGTAIFISWVMTIHALTFKLGNSVLVYKLLSVVLHFAKKPATIFSAAVRFFLYTIIPAAYVGTVQAQQLFNPDLLTLCGLAALAIISPFVATALFRRGLRLYESGNLIGARM